MAKKNIFHAEYSLMPATAIRAMQLGVIHYFTGLECKRGHTAPRYASSGNCSECIAEKRGQANIRMRGRSSKRDQKNHEAAVIAAEAGFTTYESFSPCPKGHTKRYVTSNNCCQCGADQMRLRAESSRWSRIKKIYGIDRIEYEILLKQQKECCAICSKTLSVKETHIDHCHSTGAIRGLLCGRCNQAIGLLDEDIEKIHAAAEYIKDHLNEAKRLSTEGD